MEKHVADSKGESLTGTNQAAADLISTTDKIFAGAQRSKMKVAMINSVGKNVARVLEEFYEPEPGAKGHPKQALSTEAIEIGIALHSLLIDSVRKSIK